MLLFKDSLNKANHMSLKSTIKGMLGEAVVNFGTWLMLDKEVYHRINNITLPLPDGGSTQIDHVIVSKFGIFVIETKNYKGWIFGSENQAQWTQVLHSQKYKFQNPLRQNYLHIKTLVDLLDLDESKFHSIIAFIGDCKIKTQDKLPAHVLASGWIPYIKDKQTELLNDAEVKYIVEQIKTQRFEKSWQTNAKHKAYVKNKVRDKVTGNVKDSAFNKASSESIPNTHATKPINNDITETVVAETVSTERTKPLTNNVLENTAIPNCPKCDGEMIKRVAKTGKYQGQEFWGCANFPKCRGVVNLT